MSILVKIFAAVVAIAAIIEAIANWMANNGYNPFM
jgi:hypothetical protein